MLELTIKMSNSQERSTRLLVKVFKECNDTFDIEFPCYLNTGPKLVEVVLKEFLNKEGYTISINTKSNSNIWYKQFFKSGQPDAKGNAIQLFSTIIQKQILDLNDIRKY